MLNVLDGKSNGPEKDRAFGWKKSKDLKSVQNVASTLREWRDLKGRPSGPPSTSKL